MGRPPVLVTGGLGFIGSHLSRKLLSLGHDVKILDNLEPQVHSKAPSTPQPGQLIKGDVRDPTIWPEALQDIEIVFHLAAAVGIGQSMYQVRKYVDVNSLGTATLLDHLANQDHNVKKLVVASSMSIYGEGAYECANCGLIYPGLRTENNLRRGIWEPQCPNCTATLSSKPTNEKKPPEPTSIYASTKRDQEEMCLQIGKAYGIPTIALRYFNVYGPGQSLTNPYTGVCAVFSSRVKTGQPPIIYEDGKQTRDFIDITDVVEANLLAMKKNSMKHSYYNIGTGTPTSITEVAHTIAKIHGTKIEPTITGQYRAGDIRHCWADISKIKSQGFRPKVTFHEGMMELGQWTKNQEANENFEEATSELVRHGLVSGRSNRD